jgi:hypothetical protein
LFSDLLVLFAGIAEVYALQELLISGIDLDFIITAMLMFLLLCLPLHYLRMLRDNGSSESHRPLNLATAQLSCFREDLDQL